MNHRLTVLLSLLAMLLAAGCSTVKRTAVNQVGNALSGGGETFASDDDPELIRAAVPFSLKLTESLLAETPKHRGLLLTACSGFTQYAYAFVQEDADEIEATDLARAAALRARARRLPSWGRPRAPCAPRAPRWSRRATGRTRPSHPAS